LISHQSNMRTYELVWKEYNEVAKSLGIKFPRKFAYAYPIRKNRKNTECYVVESTHFIKGNLDYSLYVTMEMLGTLINRKQPLYIRLDKRRNLIRERAIKYFTLLDNPDKIELISEFWEVKENITELII